ncbi:LANO_0G07140g1_1 [Lachancea nothofagi CBS 11611]|uniref:LANO_0G07140g1_1 n=1 Tax=Lachancea nothofagi CBS 11611 TaxID=1266666 RepID=A0A1G4KHR3_9SACH|nr:LANO_0G07140g1_1 [Lachancea nothofagi CBS 11611]
MAFLVLTSEVSTPFVIPAVSPVSAPSSRKNSTGSLEAARKI